MKTLLVGALLLLTALTLLAADLTGTWTATVVLDAGSGTATFNFKQTGEKLSGSYSGTFGESTVTGTVKGKNVEWSFDNAQAGKITYTGVLESDTKIKGTTVYGQVGTGSFTAEKK